MRKLYRIRTFLLAALIGAMVLGATPAIGGESAVATAERATASSWSAELSDLALEDQDIQRIGDLAPTSDSASFIAEAGTADDADRAFSSETDKFVPLLAREESRSLSATWGIADSATAGLLDAESSGTPAVVPLPASVWAGLAVLLTTVWLGRHSKRRLRLPI